MNAPFSETTPDMDRTDFWCNAAVDAVRGLRLDPVSMESELHAAIAGVLTVAGVPFEREVTLSPGNRIDFLCAGGVGIEVKKGKPNRAALDAQAARYCASDRVAVLILAVERNVAGHVSESSGKEILYVSLNKNWGIAS